MFYEYVKGNQQMNLQMNRQLSAFKDDLRVKEDLSGIIPSLTDLNSWFETWYRFGEKRELNGDYDLACVYFSLAQFYLKKNDENKKDTVHRYLNNFYLSYKELEYESYEVPYDNSFLPAIKIKMNPNATKTLLVISGFDSFMEEILAVIGLFKGTNYNIILFDGPGQGRALINHDLKFTPYFEKPVSAVLDYFGLAEVDAMGVSWGGYFVVRAAAYEKRIKRVVCFDFFYDGIHVFLNGLEKNLKDRIIELLHQDQADEINKLINEVIDNNLDLQFKFNKGYENTGKDTPYDLLKNITDHNIRGLGKLVTQDVLLLAGKEDHYVPFEDLILEQNELINTRSLVTKIFTKETGGEQHCQAGRYDLAINEIRLFLGEPGLL